MQLTSGTPYQTIKGHDRAQWGLLEIVLTPKLFENIQFQTSHCAKDTKFQCSYFAAWIYMKLCGAAPSFWVDFLSSTSCVFSFISRLESGWRLVMIAKEWNVKQIWLRDDAMCFAIQISNIVKKIIKFQVIVMKIFCTFGPQGSRSTCQHFLSCGPFESCLIVHWLHTHSFIQ